MDNADSTQIKTTLEALLLASDRPLSEKDLCRLLSDDKNPVSAAQVRDGINALMSDYAHRGVELKALASGFRFQTRESFSQFVARLWEEKPPRYTRAVLETLALIAYCQPITRAEIEAVRGVTVSTKIIRLLEDREWIIDRGRKEVPGRPVLYGTTKQFLDYFNLRDLKDLPSLPELNKIKEMYPDLNVMDANVNGDKDDDKNRETLNPDDELSDSSSDNVVDASG